MATAHMRRAMLGVLGCLLATMCAVAPAQAAPAWLQPADVSAVGTKGQDVRKPQVAVDQDGNAIAVWHRFNGTRTIVQAAIRRAGGAFGPATDLSATNQDGYSPEVAIDPQGNAVVVWYGSGGLIRSAARPAGGSWQAAITLSTAGSGRAAYVPQVAFDAQGNATAVWYRHDGAGYVIQSATRPEGGTWQAPVAVSAVGHDAYDPQIAFDRAGDATAVWYRQDDTGHFIVQSATRPTGEAWRAPVDLSEGAQTGYVPQLAVNARGDAVAVWYRAYNGPNTIAQAAIRPAGEAWQKAVDLSAPGQDVFDPQVAINQKGAAIATWTRFNGTHDVVQAAARPAGRAWQPAVTVSAPGVTAFSGQVSFDPFGNAIAVWTGTSGSTTAVQSATRVRTGVWGAATTLSDTGRNAVAPQLAVDPQGNATAVWRRSNGTNDVVQSAGYDAAGPRFAGWSLPSSAVAGEPVSLSVSPVDMWSGIAGTSWLFGDATGDAGTSATHVYEQPGTYTARVTSTDVLDNSYYMTFKVKVAPAPAPEAL